jgi:membrane-bound serine protease (ClpP class)
LLDGEVLDAFTRGEFIEKGEAVEVIGTEGVTLRVRKITE